MTGSHLARREVPRVMQDLTPTRRTTLKVLALLGVGTTGSAGVTTADEHNTDDQNDDQRNDGQSDSSGPFIAQLEPQEDVETDAHGIAFVQERQDGLKFVVGVEDLEDAIMGHIHEDEVLGPIAVWLYDFETQAERLEEGQFTGILDVGTITDEVIAAGRVPEAESETAEELLEKIDAGEAYVNIHTEENPSGEIAGLLEPFDLSDVRLPTDTDDGSEPADDNESTNDSEADSDTDY
ncbi:CHRD domain-containing protein [Natronococcus wangiae]|uniref:CHRD domain-containing protein n=1 Tax=Natronococcus wangiae TaxID=3068275 RepID=UPI00273D82C0|nr:CHRD domain-containing protein [Natronococcus sp. AD5]